MSNRDVYAFVLHVMALAFAGLAVVNIMAVFITRHFDSRSIYLQVLSALLHATLAGSAFFAARLIGDPS